jgi:hypothetical protein
MQQYRKRIRQNKTTQTRFEPARGNRTETKGGYADTFKKVRASKPVRVNTGATKR